MRILPKTDVLIRLRVVKGWSREALARAAKVNEQTVNRLEEGYSVRPSTAKKIQDALEVEFDEIYTLET